MQGAPLARLQMGPLPSLPICIAAGPCCCLLPSWKPSGRCFLPDFWLHGTSGSVHVAAIS